MKRFLVAYFFAVFFFATFFSSGFIDSQDGMQYLAIARRMYYDHTFEMPDADFPKENIYMSVNKGADGKRYSPTGLGYSIALLPAVAGEDLLYRLAGQQPLAAFPLSNDWPVWLFGSMTNAFFGAIFVVTLYAYLKTFDLDHWPAVAYSLIGLIATNLFPYTKHTFAHMMFISFMTLSFFFLRRFGQTKLPKYIVYAAASFGVVTLSYNPTYLLVAPALAVYYLLQSPPSFTLKKEIWFSWLKNVLTDTLLAVLAVAPFLGLYWWFNLTRFSGGLQTGYGSEGIPLPAIPEAYVFMEGFWGLLFSPGKSIFLFTPVFILLITHWFKILKKWRSELITGSLLFAIFFYFMGTLLGDVDFLLWHGEASWGPRYMLPTIPMLYLVVVGIATRLNRLHKWLVFVPLVLLGVIVQLTGMLLPYQTRFAGLQTDVMFNGRNHTVYEYGNQIPRYSPFFNQFKRLAKKAITYHKQLNHSPYNLVLKDGFNRPFYVVGGVWREPSAKSTISFESSDQSQVSQIEFRFRNHQIQSTGTASAQLSFNLNGSNLDKSLTVESDTEEVISFDFDQQTVEGANTLVIYKEFIGFGHTKKSQVVFLQSVHINGQPVGIGTVDYPYVSPVSSSLFGYNYDYYGNIEQNPWELWNIHSGVYEETFDLWWLRPLHFWDLPKKWFFAGFIFSVFGWVFSSYLMIRFSKKIT